MPPLRVEDHFFFLRRGATGEFSPAFQGWDQANSFDNLFVASATVERFIRR
jgi:hypothetical protein